MQHRWTRTPTAKWFALLSMLALAVCLWSTAPGHAQPEETLDESAADVDDAPAGRDAGSDPADGDAKTSWLDVIISSGIVGLLIFLLSLVGVFFIVEHFMTIRKSVLMPEPVIAELEQLIADGQIDQAIEYCYQPHNYSLVSNCVLAGLERFKASEFGFAEYKAAVEEAGEDQTGRLYRKTEVLGLIGAIAPMLGLSGTVLGMIVAFRKIAETRGMARPDELAEGIYQALVTTVLGVFVAIPAMIAFSFFRKKIDSIVAEAGKRVERIMTPLGRQK